MARIFLERGDTCEVEDNVESGWNPESVDDLTVELVDYKGEDYWEVRTLDGTKTGLVKGGYLHFRS